jgi:hypothetical protein
LIRDCKNSYLALDPKDGAAMDDRLVTRSRIGSQWAADRVTFPAPSRIDRDILQVLMRFGP